MNREWYKDAGGNVEGPISADELKAMAASGRLRPTDSVSTDRVKWLPAASVEGLSFPQRSAPLIETVISGTIPVGKRKSDTGVSQVPIVQVSGYRLLDTLGAGACGVVYKARHEKLNRIVALKTVLMPDKATQDLLNRFKQEAVSLARLQHPNIVAIYDSGQCDKPKEQVYFAMELLDGEDLELRIKRGGPLDEQTAWLIARQTAAALAHAAKHGVIHRDIKPANLFLVPAPTGFPLPPNVPMVKVTDFGLAMTRGGTVESDVHNTAAGVLLGTPVYMAPEQFTASNVDPRADIYSLGATLYQMLTGRPPYDGNSVWEVMRQKSAPPLRLSPPISSATIELVAGMMATDPNDRPADYADLIARIDSLPCLEGAFGLSGLISLSGRPSNPVITLPTPEKSTAPPQTPSPSRRRGRLYALAVVVLFGVGIGVAALAGVFNRSPLDPPSLPRANYAVGETELLYVSGTLNGWQTISGQWAIEQDDEIEKTQVIAGMGLAARPFQPRENFRVTLGIDPHKAGAVELTIATSSAPGATTRWLVRLDRKAGAVFGKRVGSGAFEAIGNAVPFPTPEELEAARKRPFLEIRYERAGDTLEVWLQSDQLGTVPAADLRTSEFRIQATGGPVRIDYALLEVLIEK